MTVQLIVFIELFCAKHNRVGVGRRNPESLINRCLLAWGKGNDNKVASAARAYSRSKTAGDYGAKMARFAKGKPTPEVIPAPRARETTSSR
ncbi:MAG: hypothetical protein LBI87_09975 [Candidatus Accumulibacter sp.]|jgi:hypothetical protein|nr:hypothetical protein [Accumulibacter sp.]